MAFLRLPRTLGQRERAVIPDRDEAAELADQSAFDLTVHGMAMGWGFYSGIPSVTIPP
jgi:hypothetical protein